MAGKKPKAPKQPYQEDIYHDCIAVSKIQKVGLFGGFSWIAGVAENRCGQAIPAFITAAFFDHNGNQLESNIAAQTMAPGARWNFKIEPIQYKTWAIGSARIIDVQP